jgi:hypothetical protein
MENMAAVCLNNLLSGWPPGLDADRAVFLVGGRICRSNMRSEVLLQRLCGFPLEVLHFWSGLVSLGVFSSTLLCTGGCVVQYSSLEDIETSWFVVCSAYLTCNGRVSDIVVFLLNCLSRTAWRYTLSVYGDYKMPRATLFGPHARISQIQ